ncbi:hypothetical protein TorRG33x02_341510 [Trema orientale]|uniref:Uncharacterized protein n=1 Tax=Trema orientale TaxID=63057 RepID=A0A2P5AU23_TREOI|nr:hypothetical protein TorRG33x02_341510 [Trema orientale]
MALDCHRPRRRSVHDLLQIDDDEAKEEVIWMHDASIEHLLNVEKADEACQRCGGHQRRPSLTFVNSALKKRKSLDDSHSADPSLSEMPQSTLIEKEHVFAWSIGDIIFFTVMLK